MSDEWPIEIENLRKEYGEFVALNNLNLKIKKNSFTGLLGPNGAGKSTTLKILTHLINATSGSAYLDGVDVTVDPKKALSRVGTVIETPEFYGYLTPRETMRYVGELIGMRKERIKDQTEQILEKVKMTEWGDKKLGTFSKGMRQRIAIGQSLMNDPRIIILDEPTSGLDPRGMAEMREILKNLRNESKDLTIVMSSHILPEVQDLCDRIAMINHGNLLMDGDISKFTSISGARTMIVQTKDIPTDDLISRIGSLEYVHDAERFGNDIQVVINEDMDTRQRLFDDLSRMNAGVYSMYESSALEETYLKLIKESR
ncbi:MAG: ABC transporter ATP-binding protein [Methanomassiliicoccales archaeon]|uniref:ABC transporter ATP-binding protein n=1 Tax=Candidatus Methanarcanum hacksteinii TaxID=2911857 RepID=UPI00375D3653|nr:ABC transporter ATP-binding protein [Methanomassiliicoccales archaeon]MDD7479184.1 ABC transporter ATP-binding protein [Methanomassiliicoccales archaeon]TQS78185.1 MAG: multidrug ABC transporter ATP-binding protein [Candidatus Methanarcanum hacksteinii]